MKKEKINKWISERIKQSEDILAEHATDYLDVLNNQDTTDYCEESENNNFEAGVISGLIEFRDFLEKEEDRGTDKAENFSPFGYSKEEIEEIEEAFKDEN